MDPYKILGIDRDASTDEIRRAYRKQAAKYHPDSGGDAWIFQQISDAYEELTGETKKKKANESQKSSSSGQRHQAETSDPFADDPFGFDIPPDPPPERGYSHWQSHATRSPRTKQRKKQRRNKAGLVVGVVGVTVVATVMGIVLWGGWGNPQKEKSGAGETRSSEGEQNQRAARLGNPDSAGRQPGSAESEIPRTQTRPPSPNVSPSDSVESSRESRAANLDSPRPDSNETIPALPPHPVLLLTFDNDDEQKRQLWDSHVKDFVGRNKGATYAEGKVGRALRFNGNGFAEVYTRLPDQSSPRTLAVWVKCSPNSGDYILRYGGLTATAGPFALMRGSQWRFIDWNGGLNTSASVDTDWHHHCVTYQNNVIEYYLDGKLVGKVNRRLNTTIGMLMLGTLEPRHEKVFKGLIDELVVYDEAISHEQIQALVQLGNESQNPGFLESASQLNQPPTVLIGHHGMIQSLAISPDGRNVASATGRSVRMWNLKTGEEVWQSQFLAGGPVPALRFDPTGRTIWACGKSKTAQFNKRSGKVIRSFNIKSDDVAAITADCKTLLLKLGGQLQTYDLRSGQKTRTQRNAWTPYLSFSSDSRFALVGGFEGNPLKMVSMTSYKAIQTFPKEKARTQAVFSPDNKLIAQWTGPHKPEDSVIHQVKIFEAKNGRLLHTLDDFGGWQYQVVFSPDNRYLATVGSGTLKDWQAREERSDKKIRIWDVRNGRLVTELRGHDGCGNVAVFSPDGAKLITGGLDSLIRIWDVKY